MKRRDMKEIEESQYGKRMTKLAEDIFDATKINGQGHIFATLSCDENNANFLSFRIPKEDYISFWAAIASIIQKVRDSVKEDDLQDFREGFIPMVMITLEKCFPMIHLEGGFYDEMKGERYEN